MTKKYLRFNYNPQNGNKTKDYCKVIQEDGAQVWQRQNFQLLKEKHKVKRRQNSKGGITVGFGKLLDAPQKIADLHDDKPPEKKCSSTVVLYSI